MMYDVGTSMWKMEIQRKYFSSGVVLERNGVKRNETFPEISPTFTSTPGLSVEDFGY